MKYSPIDTSSNEIYEYDSSIALDFEWSAFDDNDFQSEKGSQYIRSTLIVIGLVCRLANCIVIAFVV